MASADQAKTSGPDPEEKIEVVNTSDVEHAFSLADHRNWETKHKLAPGETCMVQRGYTNPRGDGLGSILEMFAPGVVPVDSTAGKRFLAKQKAGDSAAPAPTKGKPGPKPKAPASEAPSA